MARVAWIGAILNLAISAILFILQIAGIDFYYKTHLPVAFEIENLTEQFNSQFPETEIEFDYGNRVHASIHIIGSVSIPSFFLHLASLMEVAGAAVAVYLFSLMKDVLRPLDMGKPFQPQSGKNIYWIGGIICLITPAKFLYEWIIYRFMLEYPLPSSITMQWPLPDFTYLIIGLIILSVAYVFNEGARMAREQQLTM